MTALLFREDAYVKSCPVTVVGVNERGGILLTRRCSTPQREASPATKGVLTVNGRDITIATTVYDENKNVVHVPAEGQRAPATGDNRNAQPRLAQPATASCAPTP